MQSHCLTSPILPIPPTTLNQTRQIHFLNHSSIPTPPCPLHRKRSPPSLPKSSASASQPIFNPQPASELDPTPESARIFTANVSFWAPLVLNIPDFTRYARSQKDQVLGQIGLPVFMGLFTFVGLAVASSTEVIYGCLISDPIQLLGKIGGFWTTVIAILGISLATITTNTAANVVAPANALVNVDPKVFDFRRGALVTALLGIAFQPWRLLASSEDFVYTWLIGYSALMGPITGVMIADYYLVKKMELDVDDLYVEDGKGRYFYNGGFNIAGLVALAAGILPIVPGFLQNVGILTSVKEVFVVAYSNAWFVSFFISAIVYWLQCKLSRTGT